MADPRSTPDPERATVSLVYRAISEVKELMAAKFDAIEVRLDAMAGIPQTVGSLERRIDAVEAEQRVQAGVVARLDDEETTGRRHAQLFRRVHLPAVIIGFLALAVGVVNSIVLTVRAF